MHGCQTFDVMVVGSGPGGSAAAKRCAERGLSTLMIEKKRLPRDKVCTGMVMGDWAHDLIREEFGEIPETVLVDPPRLSGHRLHLAGAEPQTLEWDTPLAWRKDLDFWMAKRAEEAGVTLRDGSKFVHAGWEQGQYKVAILRDGVTEEYRTRYLIGADGAISRVRRSIFPVLAVRYEASARKHYRGELSLEKDFIHWFFPKGLPTPRFNVNHKDDMFLVEGRAIRHLRSEIDETLEPYGFRTRSEPERKDSGALALMYEDLLTGSFAPARGNTLLVGDAACLMLPITYEGIGTALKSGIAAAESIAKSAKTGLKAATSYLDSLEPIVEAIRRLRSLQNDLGRLRHESPGTRAKSLVAAYRETLTVQRDLR